MAERKATSRRDPAARKTTAARKTPVRRAGGGAPGRGQATVPAVPSPPPRPTARLLQVYLYAVTLVAVLTLLFSGARAVFGIVRIAIPEETAKQGVGFDGPAPLGDPFDYGFRGHERREEAERDRGIVELGEAGILALVALVVFRIHWRRARSVGREVGGEPPASQPEPGG